MVGCDGARSDVRRALGRALHGDSANQAWGVMDVLAVTDFPDIRLKALIQSANEGSVLVIPREGGYLVRLYVELDKLDADERVAEPQHHRRRSDRGGAADPAAVHAEVKEVAWWSVYEIGQRLCDKFDDVPADEIETRCPACFIAGDACHTHSPKAGQGMNVSMQDASISAGSSLPCCAADARRAPADLFGGTAGDRQGADRLRSRIGTNLQCATQEARRRNGEGVEPAETQSYFVRHGRYTAGTATRYRPSILTGPSDAYQHLAKDLSSACAFIPRRLSGWRMPSRFSWATRSRRMDAGASSLCGRGRSGCPALRHPNALRFSRRSHPITVRKYTPAERTSTRSSMSAQSSSRTIVTLAIDDYARVPSPRKGRFGLCDYEKMFCADLKGGNDIFDMRGIDRESGCMVVVRPDQYVAHALSDPRRRPKFLPSSQISCFRCSDAINRADRYFASGHA